MSWHLNCIYILNFLLYYIIEDKVSGYAIVMFTILSLAFEKLGIFIDILRLSLILASALKLTSKCRKLIYVLFGLAFGLFFI